MTFCKLCMYVTPHIYTFMSIYFILSLKLAPETPQILEHSFAYLPSLVNPLASRRFHEFPYILQAGNTWNNVIPSYYFIPLLYIYIYMSIYFILSLKLAPETPQTLEYSFAYLPSLPNPWSASRRFHEFQWHSASCACMLLHIYIHSCPYISFSPWS